MTDAVDALRRDSLSGATELIERGARVLRDHAEGSRARTRRSFVSSLARTALLVADAQSAMAPFVHLGNAALKAAEGAEDLASAREDVVAALDAFVAKASEERARTAAAASRLVRAGSVILVYSRSSTVEATLLKAAAEKRRFTVLCPEARPAMEGRILATRLAEAGIQVTAFVDAAAFSLIPTADMVLVGADAITPVGLINKVGTSGLALLAQAANVPCYCIAGALKMLPSAALIDPHREGERLADEWGTTLPGVRVTDRYYDLTRLESLTGFVLDEGVFDADALRRRLRSIRLHPALRKPRKPRGRSRARR